jgi:hypothetical protein
MHPAFRSAALAFAALFLAGCGARSDLEAEERTTSTGSTASTSSTGSTGSTSTTYTFTGVETCPGEDTWIELSIDGGEPLLLTSVCTGKYWKNGQGETEGPVGFYTTNPVIAFVGCLSPDPESLGVLVYGSGPPAVTTYEGGSANFIDEDGDLWGYTFSSETTVTITVLEPTGGVIEGSFETEVTSISGKEKLPLSGAFRVCHVTDVLPP